MKMKLVTTKLNDQQMNVGTHSELMVQLNLKYSIQKQNKESENKEIVGM